MAENASSAAMTARFHCVVARAPDAASAERALAEALAAGASGAEERVAEQGAEPGVTLLLYAPAAHARAVRRAAAGVLGADRVALRAVAEEDWAESWKIGLRAVPVSPRLRIRPSFDRSAPAPGQRDLVIDPGQAFGTGAHESTALALAWLDALRAELPGARVLDVGTGTGVLALAALALGAERAVAFDLDPLAAPAARANAAANGAGARLALFTGTLAALAPGLRFRGIAANLLRRELEPLVAELASRLAPGGWLVVSGLLDEEGEGVAARAAAAGLRVDGERHARDAGGIGWASLLMRRRAPV